MSYANHRQQLSFPYHPIYSVYSYYYISQIIEDYHVEFFNISWKTKAVDFQGNTPFLFITKLLNLKWVNGNISPFWQLDILNLNQDHYFLICRKLTVFDETTWQTSVFNLVSLCRVVYIITQDCKININMYVYIKPR